MNPNGSDDYQRLMTRGWRDFDHGPGKFDSQGYRKMLEERRAFIAAGRDRSEAPSWWRLWLEQFGLIARNWK